MTNNAEWKERTDKWVLMLDQSRLRKEKRLANINSHSEHHMDSKIKTHLTKPINTS